MPNRAERRSSQLNHSRQRPFTEWPTQPRRADSGQPQVVLTSLRRPTNRYGDSTTRPPVRSVWGRRSTALLAPYGLLLRTIPADAENTIALTASKPFCADHPRRHGEHAS